MSFTRHQLKLTGSNAQGKQYKTCAKCNQDKPQDGGVEMGPSKWICVMCWNRGVKKP